MRSAAIFSVPKKPDVMLLSDAALATMGSFTADVDAWAGRVNARAGRTIVETNIGGIVRLATSGLQLKPGKIIVILDPERPTQPSTFHLLDQMEMLA